MSFTLPTMLLGLLPLAGVFVYLLRGVGQPIAVPFLRLWPKSATGSIRSRRRLPPPWIMLLFFASLLAILAAAGPVWTHGAPAAEKLSIVIDRGITMSGDRRYRPLLMRCDKLLGPDKARSSIAIVAVPGEVEQADGDSWLATATALPPTAIDTSDTLVQAISDLRHTSRSPIIVLTDQPVVDVDSNVTVIAPEQPNSDIAIAALSARSAPRPQVMVQMRNHSAVKSVHLRVCSGTATVEREVKFTTDTATDFIDMPALADTVSAEIASDDDIPADDAAWLVRQPAGITLDVTADVAPAVRRIAEIFARHRPPGRHVLISDQPVPADLKGIQVVTSTENARPPGPLTTASGPLTAGVTVWPGPAADIKPPDGFQVIVSRDGHALVAERNQPARQLWVNLNLADWSRTTDFVVFFSNAFEWFRKGSGDEFTSISPIALGPGWNRSDNRRAPAHVAPGLWPGLYRSDDGRLLAVNAALPEVQPTAMGGTLRDPSKWKTAAIRPGRSLGRFACWAALACAAISLMLCQTRSARYNAN